METLYPYGYSTEDITSTGMPLSFFSGEAKDIAKRVRALLKTYGWSTKEVRVKAKHDSLLIERRVDTVDIKLLRKVINSLQAQRSEHDVYTDYSSDYTIVVNQRVYA